MCTTEYIDYVRDVYDVDYYGVKVRWFIRFEINIIADEKTAKKRVEIVRKAFADVIITAENKTQKGGDIKYNRFEHTFTKKKVTAP